MNITNELLENQNFIGSTLKSLIAQECDRVVNSGLISKADCFAFIEKHKKLENGLESLLSVYNAFSNVKLAGDKLEGATSLDLEDILNKLKEVTQETPIAKECNCSGESCGCDEKKLLIKLEQLDNLITDRLEKIAYSLGNEGDHETAYLVERTLKNIKSKIEENKDIEL